MSQIGRETPLLEGRSKVDGSLRFCGDLMRPGLLHARLVTSPHAHATVRSVEVSAALQIDGVVDVMTGADLPAIPARNRPFLMLARDRVIFVGHPVALVLAESEAAAQDGADAVLADYEPLPAAISIKETMAEDAPAVWPEGVPGSAEDAAAHGAAGPEGEGNEAAASPNVCNRVKFERGDLEHGFAEADVVVEHSFDTARVHQSYLEPHVSMVELDPTGGATVWSSTQAIYFVRDAVAGILGVEATQVRSIGTPVGGGFGGKFLLYEPLLALAAKRTGRPVRLFMNRLEEMLAATPAPAMQLQIKVGARKDGTLTAISADAIMDNGCFPASMGVLAGILLGSLYKVPNQRITGTEVLTFKASTGAYRAPCAPQAAFALESVLDEIAGELGLDPLAMRLLNASAPGDPMAMGNPWPGMGMTEVLSALEQHPAWQGREQARQQGRGVGIAIGGWPGGTEPAAAACSLQPDGTLQVHISSADISGTNTSLAQIAAEAFGVESERVRVATGDTASGPFAGSSGGSKIIYTMGPAVIQAAEEARQQTLELAAASFEAAPEDLEIVDGAVRVKGSPDKSIPLAKIARRTMNFGSRQAPVYGHGRDAQKASAPGFCAQLAEVEVDRETGHVTLHRLVVVQDVGKAINPTMVRGQLHGGAMQGIGWALKEGMTFDEQGQLMTATLTDYALPDIGDTPSEFDLVLVEVPAETGPFGARGVGEPPVIATAAAIANAVADATGVRFRQLPMTPPRVAAALGTR